VTRWCPPGTSGFRCAADPSADQGAAATIWAGTPWRLLPCDQTPGSAGGFGKTGPCRPSGGQPAEAAAAGHLFRQEDPPWPPRRCDTRTRSRQRANYPESAGESTDDRLASQQIAGQIAGLPRARRGGLGWCEPWLRSGGRWLPARPKGEDPASGPLAWLAAMAAGARQLVLCRDGRCRPTSGRVWAERLHPESTRRPTGFFSWPRASRSAGRCSWCCTRRRCGSGR
jgi:hypothetical protein